jgi:hypothetical protein
MGIANTASPIDSNPNLPRIEMPIQPSPEPCASCPWRKANRYKGPPEKLQLAQSKLQILQGLGDRHSFGCHETKRIDPKPCTGYLLSKDSHITTVEIIQITKTELHQTLQELIEAATRDQ